LHQEIEDHVMIEREIIEEETIIVVEMIDEVSIEIFI
jgi:hypothetical protein